MEARKSGLRAPPRSGTQSIERAVQVLRVLSERDRFGWGLVDLAARCGLSRATTHRILAGLVSERMAHQRADRRYVLGSLVFELSLAMSEQDEFQAVCKAPVARLSKRFGTAAILYLHSGADSVCLTCAGPLPSASGLHVGTRLPLVSTAGGVAILISLPQEERRAAQEAGLKLMGKLGPSTATRLQRLIAQSERRGYAFNQGDVTKGVNSFGLPIKHPGGEVFASVVVTGPAEQFPPSRSTEVLAALREAVECIEDLARQTLRAGKLRA